MFVHYISKGYNLLLEAGLESIAAISTANGTGGVAIIRISGDDAKSIAEKMFEPIGKNAFEPNYMCFGKIQGDGFLDSGYVVYFRSPKTFTGEDIVEFHCHGGVRIARGILKRCLELGARIADKGEFTKRAFVNGKLSLSSCEGLIEMINAESVALIRAGGMLYNEKLTAKVRLLQDNLKNTLAAIAAEIDYPEEDLDGLDLQKIKQGLEELLKEISSLIGTYSGGKKIKSGVQVALCGRTNVGKSSLLNALVGYEKAIVSSQEGTTRDAVEGELFLDGVKYTFIDTAGIRENVGEVESIGIERAKNIVKHSDLVLSVDDGGGAEEFETDGKIIRVFNKCDQREPEREYDICVSAQTGQNLDKLKELIKKEGMGEYTTDSAFIVEERHYDALKRAFAAISSAEAEFENITLDLVALELKEAWSDLGEITGETANEEIISTVFEKFCVGK